MFRDLTTRFTLACGAALATRPKIELIGDLRCVRRGSSFLRTLRRGSEPRGGHHGLFPFGDAKRISPRSSPASLTSPAFPFLRPDASCPGRVALLPTLSKSR